MFGGRVIGNALFYSTFMLFNETDNVHVPYVDSVLVTVSPVSPPGYHKGQPYVGDPRVKSFIQWTKTLKDSVVLQKTAVGGHYCFPRPPQKFIQSVAEASSKENKNRIFFFKSQCLHYYKIVPDFFNFYNLSAQKHKLLFVTEL